jgi:chromosome segregation protein
MPIKLASLELNGYKTFAQKTTFDFPARITAIVGPNGSGKSNVADAIRWVLGEQSYSLLRAKKTEDMIYNGSDQRARAGMASVSITFNNEDYWLPIEYSEVVLTRRAYRDGANEYLLNNQRVRLKDFYELLAKTGLSERTYTIIGQGLVDLALSIRPDERSKLFEEAAGIGLYRTRKEEALKRLEATRRNLERAQDILDEIKPRLRNLERQAIRAREYLTIQDNLQNKLRLWYGYHWYKAQEEFVGAKAQLNTAQEARDRIQARVDTIHVEVGDLKEKLTTERDEVSRLHEQLSAFHNQLQAKNQQIAILEERERSLNREKDQLEKDLSILVESIESEQKSLDVMQAEIDQKNQELMQLQGEFTRVEAQLKEARSKKEAYDTQYKLWQNRLIDAEKDAVVIKSRKSEISERIKTLQNDINSTQATAQSLQEEEESAVLTHEALLEKQQALEKDSSVLEQKVKELLEQQADIKHKQEQVSSQINQLNLERNKLTNQIDLLRQSQESLSGFSEGAKVVLKNPKFRRQGKGFTDLATKLEVTEVYEKAITAALGEAIDLLVLEDGELDDVLLMDIAASVSEKVALAGSDGDRSKQLEGLPMDDAIVGVAAELVNYPQQLAPIIHRLLGDFLVVSSIDKLFHLPQKIRESYNLVTLDGQVLLKNGVAIVGNQRQSGKVSYIRRSKELEAALAKVNAAWGEAKNLEEKFQQENQQSERLLFEAQARLRQLSTQTQQLHKELSAAAVAIDKLSSRRKWIENQIEESQQQISKLEADRLVLDEQEGKNQLEIQTAQSELEKVKQLLTEHSTEDYERQYQYLLMEIRVTQQAVEHEAATQDALKQRLAEDEQRLHQLTQRNEEADQNLRELNEQRAELNQVVVELNNQIGTLKIEHVDKHQQQLAQLESHYQELLKQEEANEQELNITEHQLTHCQLEVSRKQEKLDSLRNRIENDFGLIQLEYQGENFNPPPLPFQDFSIDSLHSTPTPPETTEEEIKGLKAQLRRIGVVNVEAEKEYQETKNRYDNFISQISDLEAAISDLERIVKELDEVMEREFLETFKLVSAEFSRIFTRLFNGGSARLILSDNNAPLEGGIEIEARLPGKREQGLVLLSGGERSLTAVALVFALLKISPTPFCILDEVDAMMDESNVGRFIDLLKDLSNDTQFLLITHNRNTVQAADVIYGVTMGKDGVSQVMSLQLEDVDDVFLK